MALFFKDITKQEYCEKCDAYSSTLHTCVIKPELCPVEEIPIPHGRLIDVDAILSDRGYATTFGSSGGDKYYHETVLLYAPTVMEAEEEE